MPRNVVGGRRQVGDGSVDAVNRRKFAGDFANALDVRAKAAGQRVESGVEGRRQLEGHA